MDMIHKVQGIVARLFWPLDSDLGRHVVDLWFCRLHLGRTPCSGENLPIDMEKPKQYADNLKDIDVSKLRAISNEKVARFQV